MNKENVIQRQVTLEEAEESIKTLWEPGWDADTAKINITALERHSNIILDAFIQKHQPDYYRDYEPEGQRTMKFTLWEDIEKGKPSWKIEKQMDRISRSINTKTNA